MDANLQAIFDSAHADLVSRLASHGTVLAVVERYMTGQISNWADLLREIFALPIVQEGIASIPALAGAAVGFATGIPIAGPVAGLVVGTALTALRGWAKAP